MPRFAAPGAGQEVGRLVGAFLNAPALRKQAESDQRRLNTQDQLLRSRLEGQDLKNTQLGGLLGAQEQAAPGIAELLRGSLGAAGPQAPAITQASPQAAPAQITPPGIPQAPQIAPQQAPQGFQTPGIAPQLPQGAPSADIGSIASQLTGAAPGVQQPQPQAEQATPDDVQQVAQAKARGFTDQHLLSIANLLARQGNPAQAVKIFQSVALLQRGVQAGASDPTEGNRLVAASQGNVFERFKNQGGQLANLSTGELGAVTDIGRANIGLLGARANAANAQAGASRARAAALGRTSTGSGPGGRSVSTSAKTTQYQDGSAVLVTRGGRSIVLDPAGNEVNGPARLEVLQRGRESGITDTRDEAFARAEGKQAVEKIGEFAEASSGIRKNLNNIDEAIVALDNNASSGFISSFFPSIRESSVKLDNIQRRLGLDIIGATSFGALSQGELTLALQTALPTDLEPAALRQWLIDKKSAQEGLLRELQSSVSFLGQGGTLAELIALKQGEDNSDGGEQLAPQAEQTALGGLPIVAPGPQVNPLGEQPVSPIRPAPQNNPQEQAAPQTRLMRNDQTGEMTRVQLSPDGQTWVPVQ